MNMHRLFFILSLIYTLLFTVTVSFGMKCNYNGTLSLSSKKSNWIDKKDALNTSRESLYCQPQTTMPLECIVNIAAAGNGQVRNNIHHTCKFFRDILSKKNSTVLSFITNPLFVIKTTGCFDTNCFDIDDSVLKAFWYGLENKNKILSVVSNKIDLSNVHNIGLGLILEDISSFKDVCRNNSIDAYLEEKYHLNWKEYFNITDDENITISDMAPYKDLYYYTGLEILLEYAALCNDRIAMKSVCSKIKNFVKTFIQDGYYKKFTLDPCVRLLLVMMFHDKSTSFEFFIKEDPYGFIGSYYECEEQPSGQQVILDYFARDQCTPLFLSVKYRDIFQEWCAKTFPVATKEEHMPHEHTTPSCVIL